MFSSVSCVLKRLARDGELFRSTIMAGVRVVVTMSGLGGESGLMGKSWSFDFLIFAAVFACALLQMHSISGIKAVKMASSPSNSVSEHVAEPSLVFCSCEALAP